MKVRRTPVASFLAAAIFPFVGTFAFFVISQRHSLLTEPEAYIQFLKDTGSAEHMISLSTWKYFLAQDPLCREAQSIIIGSSRVREIDQTVIGTSICNLYVDNLRAPGFAHLAQNLPAVEAGQRRVVYVGIDHFWLWLGGDHFDNLDIKLLSTSRRLWRAWAIIRALNFFDTSTLLEAMRRDHQRSTRFEDQVSVWYPDGHLFHPRYYARKRAGIYSGFSQQDVDESVDSLFAGGQLRESNLRALEAGVRVLHAKGYAVEVFWNPVSPAHIATARQHFPILFQQTIDSVDRLASKLPIERYFPASQTLDPSRFGCTERDYADPTHVDLDCIHRMFAFAFNVKSQPVGTVSDTGLRNPITTRES